jgi:hypothetical protein
MRISEIQVVIIPNKGKAVEVARLLGQAGFVVGVPTCDITKFSCVASMSQAEGLLTSLKEKATVEFSVGVEEVKAALVEVGKDASMESSDGYLIAKLAEQKIMASEVVHVTSGTLSGDKIPVTVWYKGF